MSHFPIVKNTLKRGALLVAANWPVVVIQFVAESIFKLLLAVPLVGGALLVAVVLGRDLRELLSGDLREIFSVISGALRSQPAALFGFLFAFTLVLLGGSAFMFLLKGGTISVLWQAELGAGPVERPPLRMSSFERASQFTVAGFVAGCSRLFQRYFRLGLALLAIYGITAGLYLLAVAGAYRLSAAGRLPLGWPAFAILSSTALIGWITVVNLLYLLVQMAMAVQNRSVSTAIREVGKFLRARPRQVVLIFGIILLLVVLATIASIMATAGLGFIGFVPLVGLAVFPLQIAAWVVRGIVFQYLGLTALSAYLSLYRSFLESSGTVLSRPEPAYKMPHTPRIRSAS